MEFEINGVKWNIVFVPSYSDRLKRSDGSKTVGVAFLEETTIYLSNRLKGAFLRRVTAHELVHAFCLSYSIFMSIDEEERLADWVATYGSELVYLLDDLMLVLSKTKTA